MMNKPMEYSNSDVWLLQSIIWAFKNGKGDLTAIIGYADALNHAILNWEEVRDGLSKLAKGGFVKQDGGNFLPLEKALKVYDQTINENVSPYDQRCLMLKILNRSLEQVDSVSGNFTGCSKDAFEKALRAYVKNPTR